jgi:hypothetical protein
MLRDTTSSVSNTLRHSVINCVYYSYSYSYSYYYYYYYYYLRCSQAMQAFDECPEYGPI